jgi:hypothetical protein
MPVIASTVSSKVIRWRHGVEARRTMETTRSMREAWQEEKLWDPRLRMVGGYYDCDSRQYPVRMNS